MRGLSCGDCGAEGRLLQVIDRPGQPLLYVLVCRCGRWWREHPEELKESP